MIRAGIIVLMLGCSGCVVSYQHQSAPAESVDGYNLLCAGLERDLKQVRFRGDVCQDATGYHDQVIRAAIEYRPGQ